MAHLYHPSIHSSLCPFSINAFLALRDEGSLEYPTPGVSNLRLWSRMQLFCTSIVASFSVEKQQLQQQEQPNNIEMHFSHFYSLVYRERTFFF